MKDTFEQLPPSWQRLVPAASGVLALIAFAYASYLIALDSRQLVQWLRLIVFAVMGLVLLASAVAFARQPRKAWQWMVGGLSLIPILLMIQLLLFLLRAGFAAIGMLVHGHMPEPLRLFIERYPSKVDVVILAVLVLVGAGWLLSKRNGRK